MIYLVSKARRKLKIIHILGGINIYRASPCQNDWQGKRANEESHGDEDGSLHACRVGATSAISVTARNQRRDRTQHIEYNHKEWPPLSVKKIHIFVIFILEYS